MNCSDIAKVLNADRLGAMGITERRAIAAHARDCGDCAAALNAQRALVSERLPAMPRDTLERALRVTSGAQPAHSTAARGRHRRVAMALGAVMLGGAVYAAVSFLTAEPTTAPNARLAEPLSVPGESGSAATGRDDVVGDDAAASLVELIESAEADEHERFTTKLMSAAQLPDGEMFPLLKVAPRYPAAAAAAGLEGFAVIEFTVTERGDVVEPTVIESSDVLFEQASLEAVFGFKYKPRVENGRTVAVSGIRNKIRFVLGNRSEPALEGGGTAAESQERAEDELEWRLFAEMMATALECLKAGDLPRMELELDEILATQTLASGQEAALWRFYGYVHYRQENFERAIADYERASKLADGELDFWHAAPLMTVAHIYYDRAQYQQALDAAVEYLKAAPRPTVGDFVFVDELRRLGATVR